MGDQNAYRQQVEKQQRDYGDLVKKQQTDYGKAREQQMLDYAKSREKQGGEFKDLMRAYGDQRTEWEKTRGKAISTAEGKIKAIWDNYGRTFQGGLMGRWLAMSAIMAVVLVLVIVFQKRKDVV